MDSYIDPRKERDWAYLCLLLREAENLNKKGVYQFSRLKVGVYALSEGSIEGKLPKIFRYKFQDADDVCMEDRELRQDLLVSLNFLGLVNVSREKREGMKLEHYVFRITQKGSELAIKGEIILKNEDEEKLKALKEVAKDLANDELSCGDLMNKYAEEWMKLIRSLS